MYDSEVTIDRSNIMQQRICELEKILDEYKQTSGDINEIKINDNVVYRLNDVIYSILLYYIN